MKKIRELKKDLSQKCMESIRSQQFNSRQDLIYSVAVNKEIYKHVTYSGRLDLFSDLTHNKPGNVDLFWTNTFYLKINNWLSCIYSLDIAYDDDIKKFGYFKDHSALQSKSILGIGVSTTFGKKEEKTHN